MRLAHRIDGRAGAPALVLLNSIGATGDIWTPCLAPLAEQFRVIRLETRGHGQSAPAAPGTTSIADLGRDVLATLDELGVGAAHLGGVSLGGMIAMWLAIHHPERVRRLALLGTAAHLPPGQHWMDRAATVRSDGMAAVDGVPAATWITSALAERDPELLTCLRTMLGGTDAESYAQCCEAIAAMDLRPDLGRIGAPTLVIAGADDPAAPVECAETIANAVAGSHVVMLGQAAHIATVEQPGRVVDLLLGHFGGRVNLAAGYATRRAVLGDEHVDRAIAATTELTAPFQEFLTRYAWGEVWSRPGLARRERSIATLAALVALGAEAEIAMHIRAAVRNGLSPAEIAEVLLHTALYAGLPRANRAFAIAREVLDES